MHMPVGFVRTPAGTTFLTGSNPIYMPCVISAESYKPGNGARCGKLPLVPLFGFDFGWVGEGRALQVCPTHPWATLLLPCNQSGAHERNLRPTSTVIRGTCRVIESSGLTKRQPRSTPRILACTKYYASEYEEEQPFFDTNLASTLASPQHALGADAMEPDLTDPCTSLCPRHLLLHLQSTGAASQVSDPSYG